MTKKKSATKPDSFSRLLSLSRKSHPVIVTVGEHQETFQIVRLSAEQYDDFTARASILRGDTSTMTEEELQKFADLNLAWNVDVLHAGCPSLELGETQEERLAKVSQIGSGFIAGLAGKIFEFAPSVPEMSELFTGGSLQPSQNSSDLSES